VTEQIEDGGLGECGQGTEQERDCAEENCHLLDCRGLWGRFVTCLPGKSQNLHAAPDFQ
jgi:hypothetical protein